MLRNLFLSEGTSKFESPGRAVQGGLGDSDIVHSVQLPDSRSRIAALKITLVRAVLGSTLCLGAISLVVLSPIGSTALVRSAQGAYFTLGGQRDQVIRPSVPNGDLVLYVHGAGGSAASLEEAPQATKILQPLLAAGFTVASSDADGPQTWGNPASVAAYVALAHHLRHARIGIVAQSMGGLDGVQLIDLLHPFAWAGIYPVDNLASIGPSISPLYWQIFETAWEGQPPKSVSPAKAEDVTDLPVLLWASPEDTIVPKVENADVMAHWMRRGGAHVTEVTTEGDHGDPSNFQPARLVRFFLKAPPRTAWKPVGSG